MPFKPGVGVVPKYVSFKGLWDTGASGTVITQNVVDALNLPIVGQSKVYHADGDSLCPVYLASIALPNQVLFPSIRVTLGKLTGFDVLIGMDLMTQGDLAITNVGGNTVFSFRMPSIREIDFATEVSGPKPPEIRTGPKVGRNDLCPCGSGKKHKYCHGAK
jgi:predicted aspartyl protease